MLRINAIPNSDAAKAYYSKSDYYIEGEQHQAHWHGKGAEKLGLSGLVRQADFEDLCENHYPGTRDQLTAKHLQNRRVGYDFTFSVPKSMSLAYALGGDDRIPGEFRAAVAETLAEMEREMETRVRRGGQNTNRTVGNMVWADFLHYTSRPIKGEPDPQLHIHAVVFNTVYDSVEGQWKAGEFAALKANAPYFQAMFRARLANKMQALGYEIKKTKDDFEIVGIPPRTLKEFSRRTDQIEKLADQLGVTRPETKAKLGATSRERKTHGLTWDDLVRLWTGRTKPDEMKQIVGTVADANKPVKPFDRSKEAVQYALDHLLERRSVVPERQVLTEALKHGLGSVTPESIYDEMHKRKDLIRRKVDGLDMVTTKTVLNEEKSVLAFAQKGRGRFRPLASATREHNANGKNDIATLSPSQQAAIRHVWTSPDRLILIRGAAGTGKTTLTKTALAKIDRYVILAPSAEASRGVLRKDGFQDAETLAKFLMDEKLQEKARNGLIWLDEASMAGSRDVAKLVGLAEKLNARVVFSGDRRQHKSIARGDVLAMLEDKAGLPVAEVSEIKRQKGEYKQVAEMLSKGDMEKALDKLDKMGWVKETGVVADYLAALDKGKSALVIVPTHAEGDQVTEAIRDQLKADGKLKDEREVRRLRPLNWTGAELAEAKKNGVEPGIILTRTGAYREERQNLAVGDVLRTNAPMKDFAGRKIDSGTTLTLTGWTEGGNMRVKTASGMERVIGKDAGHLAAGYVSTSQAGQGRTVDVALLWMPQSTFAAVRKDTAYVSGTRGRESLTIYTDSKVGLLEAIQRDDQRLLASDLIRLPRHGLRERLKRHAQYLRNLIGHIREVPFDRSLVRDQINSLER